MGRNIHGDIEKAKQLILEGKLNLTAISIETGVTYNRALALKKKLQPKVKKMPTPEGDWGPSYEASTKSPSDVLVDNEIGKVSILASVEKREPVPVNVTITMDDEDSSERVEPSEPTAKVNTPEPPVESLYDRLTKLRTVLQGALAELDAIEQEVHDVDSAKQQLEQVRRILGVVG